MKAGTNKDKYINPLRTICFLEYFFLKKIATYMFHPKTIYQGFMLLFIFVLHFIFLATNQQNVFAQQPPTDTNCCECHTDICEVNLTKTYVHTPFLEQQCAYCHVYDEAAVETAQTSTSKDIINQLDYNVTPALEHWFVFPSDVLNSDKILVSSRDVMGNTHKEVLTLPPFETLPVKLNDTRPPVIETPEVIGVYQGIFISARIGWQTDEVSDSEIRYGINTLQYSIKEDRFSTDHEIVLQNLQAGQTYQFMVVSQDIFGNKAESDIAFFSTEILSPHTPIKLEQFPGSNVILEAQFFQYDSSYLMKLTANLPITPLVSNITTIVEEIKVAEAAVVNIPGHLPLKSRDELQVSMCTKCHNGFNHKGNHPLNVLPSLNVTIPTDYLTSSDGYMTCVTCHASHASDYENILRFQYKGDNMIAGGFDNIYAAQSMEGCFVCHSDKGVLPQNRM
ncbi:MAG: hypothetical protein AMJ61_09805 [Desulfobacterales bacterium SG8_35_2]|nr:MAG: hypothetical protein AMJ61_09805 [Desulfobacterales bacterium SG8_35_2]